MCRKNCFNSFPVLLASLNSTKFVFVVSPLNFSGLTMAIMAENVLYRVKERKEMTGCNDRGHNIIMTCPPCTRLLFNMHRPYFLSRKRLSTVRWKLEECAVVIGGRSADLGPKLDLILWLGSLGLTCQGLPGFSAASSIGMLLVALCVHLDPTYVNGWQGRERSGQPEAKVPRL